MRWCGRPPAQYSALGQSPLAPLPAGRRDGKHRRDGAEPSTASAADQLTTPIRAAHRAPSSWNSEAKRVWPWLGPDGECRRRSDRPAVASIEMPERRVSSSPGDLVTGSHLTSGVRTRGQGHNKRAELSADPMCAESANLRVAAVQPQPSPSRAKSAICVVSARAAAWRACGVPSWPGGVRRVMADRRVRRGPARPARSAALLRRRRRASRRTGRARAVEGGSELDRQHVQVGPTEAQLREQHADVGLGHRLPPPRWRGLAAVQGGAGDVAAPHHEADPGAVGDQSLQGSGAGPSGGGPDSTWTSLCSPPRPSSSSSP
jgi:hypothetical protein